MAVVAAFYPLWGALLGGGGAVLFLRSALMMTPVSAAAWLVIGWIVIAAAEAAISACPVLASHSWRGSGWSGLIWLLAKFSVKLHSTDLVLIAIVSHSVARASVIAMTWVSRPSREGMTLQETDSFSAGLAIACGALTALLRGIRPAMSDAASCLLCRQSAARMVLPPIRRYQSNSSFSGTTRHRTVNASHRDFCTVSPAQWCNAFYLSAATNVPVCRSTFSRANSAVCCAS